jgi:hypothetical protein
MGIWDTIGPWSSVLLACRAKRLGVILWVRPQKSRSHVTAGVGQKCKFLYTQGHKYRAPAYILQPFIGNGDFSIGPMWGTNHVRDWCTDVATLRILLLFQPQTTSQESTCPVRLWRHSASSGTSSAFTIDVETSLATSEYWIDWLSVVLLPSLELFTLPVKGCKTGRIWLLSWEVIYMRSHPKDHLDAFYSKEEILRTF